MFGSRILVAVASLALAHPALADSAAAGPQPASAQAEHGSAARAAQDFIEAFNALDPARFDPLFAEKATMFFPEGPFPRERVEGREAVLAAFHAFFNMAKERGATRLNIQPQDLQVQELGDMAIASFHLRGADNVGRRTLVFRKEAGAWRIVHFHASSVKKAGASG